MEWSGRPDCKERKFSSNVFSSFLYFMSIMLPQCHDVTDTNPTLLLFKKALYSYYQRNKIIQKLNNRLSMNATPTNTNIRIFSLTMSIRIHT